EFPGRPSFFSVSRCLCGKNQDHGGDVGRISSYSDVSWLLPERAGMSVKSSLISSRMRTLRNLVMNRSALRWPASCWSWRTSSAEPDGPTLRRCSLSCRQVDAQPGFAVRGFFRGPLALFFESLMSYRENSVKPPK